MTSLTEEVPRSEMMCILGVPATMTSPDLLQFIGPVEYGLLLKRYIVSDINETSNIWCIQVFCGHFIYTVTSQIRPPWDSHKLLLLRN